MPRFLPSLIVLTLVSGVLGIFLADTPPGRFEFTSANGDYTFAMTARVDTETGRVESWSLTHIASGETRYTMTGRFADKIIVVGLDGRTIVVIDYWSDSPVDTSRSLITVYRDAVVISSFSLDDLSIPAALTTTTVSGFFWYLEAVIETPLVTSDHHFALTSFDLRTFAFDLQTGALVSAEPDARLRADTALVSGLAHGTSPQFTIEVACILFGDIGSARQLPFRLTSQQVADGVIRGTRNTMYRPADGLPFTAMIRNGRLLDAWALYANSCTAAE